MFTNIRLKLYSLITSLWDIIDSIGRTPSSKYLSTLRQYIVDVRRELQCHLICEPLFNKDITYQNIKAINKEYKNKILVREFKTLPEFVQTHTYFMISIS